MPNRSAERNRVRSGSTSARDACTCAWEAAKKNGWKRGVGTVQRSVLIVDDCAAMRRVIRRILGMSGFEMSECYTAGDGEEALSILHRHRVDLILSDVNMPHLDGEGL